MLRIFSPAIAFPCVSLRKDNSTAEKEMSINLPGNTAGFSADTQPNPGGWTTAYKGDGKAAMREKRRVEDPCGKPQGIFDPQESHRYSNRSLTPQQTAGNALAPGFKA
jgi:hypothetical protein